MPTTVTINYQGKRAAGYIAEAIANGVMITGNHLTTLWEVKSKINIPIMKVDGIIQPYSTNFVDGGTIELTDKQLDPQTLSVMFEMPIPIINTLYESEKAKAGYSNTMVPTTYEEYLIAYIQKKIANDMDNFIWNSDTATTGTLGTIDGLLKQISTSLNVVPVVGTTLTQSNIIAELGKVYQAIPEDVSTTRLFVSKKTDKLLRQALFSLVGKTVDESKTLPFDPDTLIIAVPNFPANKIVAASPENLFFAGDAEADMSTINIIDMRTTTGDDKIRFRMDFKLDVKTGFDTEIVYYA